ncbi:hypothetical protein RV15_GL002009 [Enterococcus silesiacus]|nr:hypothetical protein RV15_GL002009 [Enterococcus silesiacus]
MLASVCFMTLLFKNHLIIFPFYFLSYLFTLYYYFPSGHLFGFTWLGSFLQKILQTYPKMLSGEINYLPDYFALSIILFLLLLLSVLFILYERWTFGCLLLITYLLMLSVFNHLNLGVQVILITSFAILFYGLKQTARTLVGKEKSTLFLLSGFVLFLLAGGSYFFPIVLPQSQNFLFTQTANIRNYVNQQGIYQQIEAYGSNGLSKSGFSDNDKQLGGPMSDNQMILFTAKQTSEHYWRVETKNYFTGKGWKNTSEAVSISNEPLLTISTNPEYQDTTGAETTITLSFNNQKEYLPYPYGQVSIPVSEVGQTGHIKDKQRINLLAAPDTIKLTWQKPSFTPEVLQQVPYRVSQDAPMTQVPMTTPKRVHELALSLTENQETLYGKVKAIERYLKDDGDYRYSKTDTPFTPQNEDYVDYFLFESKIGYCDNFSSAMTILLRSIGISSRWAKGFAPGEITSNNNSDYQEYTVRNSDAHSWPEVYFEGYGWIPFEPTPSFTNDVSQPAVTHNSTTENTIANTNTETSTPTESKETTAITSSSPESSTKEDTQDSILNQWRPVLRNIVSLLLIVLLAICSFFLKKYFFLLRFSLYLNVHPRQFGKAYTILLRKAEHILCRQANEPLTIYAKRFEHNYSQFHGSFIQLTELYEQTLYGRRKPKEADYAGLLIHLARLLTDLKKKSKKKSLKQN